MRLRWGDKIGSGGYGEVLKATDLETGQKLAVKRLLPGWAADERSRRRFAREVRLHRQLNHPNVMPILLANLKAPQPYYVMPKAARTLAKAVNVGVDEDWISEVFLQILAGVEAAHEKGIIHRDIKPQNVLQLTEGAWVLSDFGAGRELDRTTTTLTRNAEGIGTIDYMAPEQYEDATSTDRRGDLFSLGKLLLFMVTGKSPVPFRPPLIPGGVFGPIIDRATQSDPAHRYQSVDDLITAIVNTSVRAGFESPRETQQRLRDELQDPKANLTTLYSVVDFLARFPDLGDAHRGLVPYIPVRLVEELRSRAEDSFQSLIQKYDEHVSGGLPFPYCDVVADFYRSLVARFDDAWLFRLVMDRLLDMGWSHNRWHVQGVVVGILRGNLTDAQVAAGRQSILGNEEAAAWTFEDFDIYEMPGPIIEAIERTQPDD